MFRNAIPLMRIMGFQLRIDPSWVPIALLVVWSLSSSHFPYMLPGRSTGAYVALGVIGAAGLFGSLILHELAHAVIARARGIRIRGITLFLFGGVAEMASEPSRPRDEFWIAIAGPAASFALAVLFFAAGSGILGSGAPAAVLSYLVLVNAALGIFNLIPAFPMDGGRVLRAWLWARTGDMNRATRWAARTGIALGLALAGLGAAEMLAGAGVGGIWMILIGFFVVTTARANLRAATARGWLAGRSAADLASVPDYAATPETTVEAVRSRGFGARGGPGAVAVVSPERAYLGLVPAETVRRAEGTERLAALMVPAERHPAARSDLPAETALRLMARLPIAVLPVAEPDGTLVGIVEPSDLERIMREG